MFLCIMCITHVYVHLVSKFVPQFCHHPSNMSLWPTWGIYSASDVLPLCCLNIGASSPLPPWLADTQGLYSPAHSLHLAGLWAIQLAWSVCAVLGLRRKDQRGRVPTGNSKIVVVCNTWYHFFSSLSLFTAGKSVVRRCNFIFQRMCSLHLWTDLWNNYSFCIFKFFNDTMTGKKLCEFKSFVTEHLGIAVCLFTYLLLVVFITIISLFSICLFFHLFIYSIFFFTLCQG